MVYWGNILLVIVENYFYLLGILMGRLFFCVIIVIVIVIVSTHRGWEYQDWRFDAGDGTSESSAQVELTDTFE